jgi:licheninase
MSDVETTSSNPTKFDARDWFDRVRTVLASNSSLVGAAIVLAALFIGQRLVTDWLEDSRIIDESDLPAAITSPDEEIAADASDSCDPWIPTFADEFDGAELNDEQWIRYDSPGRDGIGLRRPEAIEVTDGNLVITGQDVDGEIISGGLATTHQQMYGRFEARVRTEVDPSETMSGAIVTWPAGNRHPEGGENELYVTLNNPTREPFYSYIHHPDTSQEEIIHQADAERWHEVAMEWSEAEIVIHRNGEQVGTVSDPEVIPDHPHVLTIQLDATQAVMGDEPVRMYVDWVRVYRANELSGDC